MRGNLLGRGKGEATLRTLLGKSSEELKDASLTAPYRSERLQWQRDQRVVALLSLQRRKEPLRRVGIERTVVPCEVVSDRIRERRVTHQECYAIGRSVVQVVGTLPR